MTQSRDLWTPHIGRNPGDIDTSVGESESYLEVHNCVIELWGNAVSVLQYYVHERGSGSTFGILQKNLAKIPLK